MLDFKERKNLHDTVRRVRQVLAGHQDLLAGFNDFLPPPKALTAAYLVLVTRTLKEHPELCQQLNRIIWQHTKREIDANTLRESVNNLVAEYPNLLL
jgi:histone deacetylase complex regulatory component SIN3